MTRNICWQCKHWEKCLQFRYAGQALDYMKKIAKEKDSYGEDVVYVAKCEKYEYENPDYCRKYLSNKELLCQLFAQE